MADQGCKICERKPGEDYTIGCPGCFADEHAEEMRIDKMTEDPLRSETRVLTPVGEYICCPSAESDAEGAGYIRFINQEGKELVYWDSAEWGRDPKLVMGAIMGFLQNGAEGLLLRCCNAPIDMGHMFGCPNKEDRQNGRDPDTLDDASSKGRLQ